MSRYDVTGSEGDYQPGSNGLVLKNSLSLTDPIDIAEAETELLSALYQKVFADFPQKLDQQLVFSWHRWWLGNLYPWAGQTRSVNMSKPDIQFAAPIYIPALLDEFEAGFLQRYDDLPHMSDKDLVAFLAQMHVEFILIHPFREGNGRISRLLLDVMAVKAGLQSLDYQLWDDHKEFYFKAIQAGRDGDCQHVERLLRDVLDRQ